MKKMNATKRYALLDSDIYVASKSEQAVGDLLIYFKYNFIYDKKYPYDATNLRFDFMILNKADTKENITTNHHLFIEVKDNDENYLEELNEKRKLVNENDDVLIVLTDKDRKIEKDLIEEGLAVMRLKAEVKNLRYENFKLKNKK